MLKIIPATVSLIAFAPTLAADPIHIRIEGRNPDLAAAAQAYLTVMQSDDEPMLERMLAGRLAARNLQRHSTTEWTAMHMNIARQISTFDEYVISEDAPLALEVLTRLTPEPGDEDEDPSWVQWRFVAPDDDPSKITTISIVNALPPIAWLPDYQPECEDADPAHSIAERLIGETKTPSLAFAIATLDEGGRPNINAAVVGVRNINPADPALLTDPVHIGSCTKSATALLLATLVRDELLSFDDTIQDHLGNDASFDIHPDYRRVTLAQVLRHRAGLVGHSRDIADAIDRYSNLAGTPTEQRAAYLADVLSTDPVVPPGEMNYSNAGYCLIAYICERVLGTPYESAIRDRVFAPLGIASAGFGWTAAPADPDGIWGHGIDDSTGNLAPFQQDLQLGPFLAAAGDLHLSVRDFALLSLQHAIGPDGNSPIAPRHIFDELHRPSEDGIYAAGVGRNHKDGHAYLGHAGSTGVYWAKFRVWPDLDLAAVVAVNAPISENAERHIDAAFRAIANRDAE